MNPTIHNGDRMVVNTAISDGILKGDIVVFEMQGKSF
ncbi:S24/S26 family peptidase [Cohnella soli]|uniref:S24/S26 family peptidase n=1 Tax=Cohnella soli TaxID=425005 RepID=A0ABW0HZZ7_9BACL